MTPDLLAFLAAIHDADALAWGYRHREGYRADLWAPDGVEVGA